MPEDPTPEVAPEHLAADGAAVIDGVDAPSEGELAAQAERGPHEVQAAIDAHIGEVDRGDG
jgi:hypothetical protein